MVPSGTILISSSFQENPRNPAYASVEMSNQPCIGSNPDTLVGILPGLLLTQDKWWKEFKFWYETAEVSRQ